MQMSLYATLHSLVHGPIRRLRKGLRNGGRKTSRSQLQSARNDWIFCNFFNLGLEYIRSSSINYNFVLGHWVIFECCSLLRMQIEQPAVIVIALSRAAGYATGFAGRGCSCMGRS